MSDAMSAEFGTVAEWTAEVATQLGPSHYVPAACRGSGSPAALDWLMDRLELSAGETFVDCGAGVGGPAAYAAQRRSVHPVMVEPEAGACRAARALFDHPVVRADASALPFPDETFDAAWSLGVLCTTLDQLALLTELRRVVRAPGRIGLLVFVARTSALDGQPEGNHFPTRDSLIGLVDRAGLQIDAWHGTADLPSAPSEWQGRVDEVTAQLSEQHGGDRLWQLAEQQSDAIGELLADSSVTGELLSLRHR